MANEGTETIVAVRPLPPTRAEDRARSSHLSNGRYLQKDDICLDTRRLRLHANVLTWDPIAGAMIEINVHVSILHRPRAPWVVVAIRMMNEN